MGRPSKLSEAQWAQVEKRIHAGETPARLAAEFKIDRAAITRRLSQQVRNVKAVANQLVAAEDALRDLPVAQQLTAISLADQLRAMSAHLANAATNGAYTASHASSLARKMATGMADFDHSDEESIAKVRSINALTNLANSSSEIARDLLKTNKEKAGELDEPGQMNWTINAVAPSANAS